MPCPCRECQSPCPVAERITCVPYREWLGYEAHARVAATLPAGVRLGMGMLPEAVWENNARAWLSTRQWDRVRRATYRLYDSRCAVCGATPPRGRLHCHERWEVDDVRQTIVLVGLLALCADCHALQHMGHTAILVAEGKRSWRSVVRHFCTVNGVTEAVFDAHYAEVVATFTARNARQGWRVECEADLAGFLGETTPGVPYAPRGDRHGS